MRLFLVCALCESSSALGARRPLRRTALGLEGGGQPSLEGLPFRLEGRKVVASWKGDALDLAGGGVFGAAGATAVRVGVKVASRVVSNVVFAGAVVAAASYAGVVTVDAARLCALVRSALPGEVATALGRYDDAAAVRADVERLARGNEHRALGVALGAAAALL